MRIPSGAAFSAALSSARPDVASSPRERLAANLAAALGTVAGAQAAKVLTQPVRTGLKDGTHIDVYYNLHHDILSLRDHGLVEAHAPAAFLSNVEFVVNQAGRERVVSEGRKNVHAFVRGDVRAIPPYAELAHLKPVAVTYNPYKFTSFVERATLAPIFGAKYVAVIDKQILAFV